MAVGYPVSGGILLHRLVAEGAIETLRRREGEITATMLAATCTVGGGWYTEVRPAGHTSQA
jgi:hypothetical protein